MKSKFFSQSFSFNQLIKLNKSLFCGNDSQHVTLSGSLNIQLISARFSSSENTENPKTITQRSTVARKFRGTYPTIQKVSIPKFIYERIQKCIQQEQVRQHFLTRRGYMVFNSYVIIKRFIETCT